MFSDDGDTKEHCTSVDDTTKEDMFSNATEGDVFSDGSSQTSEELSSADRLLRHVLLNVVYGNTVEEYQEKLRECLCDGMAEKEAKEKAKRDRYL